jgi:tetratricopeptide (TPR) repeat protein
VIATAVCNTYIELGVTAYQQGYTDVADQMLNAALEEAQRLGSKQSPPCAVFNKLAHLYYKQNNFERAEQVYEQALALYERLFTENDAALSGMLLNLAELYFSRQKYDRALPLYERALHINQKSESADSPTVERCLLKLAWLYCNSERFDDAQKIYNRARLVREAKPVRSNSVMKAL